MYFQSFKDVFDDNVMTVKRPSDSGESTISNMKASILLRIKTYSRTQSSVRDMNTIKIPVFCTAILTNCLIKQKKSTTAN